MITRSDPQSQASIDDESALFSHGRMVSGVQSLALMNDEERERMNEICAKLQVEQDQHKFTELLKQLNNLLERKGQYLEQKAETDT